MRSARRLAGCSLAAAAIALAGCATPVRTSSTAGPAWSGRMALQVEGDASQSFTAAFELVGSARTGELNLFTPLGGTAGRIRWSPEGATLFSGGQTRQFPSLEALASEATGAPIPIAALFDWLAGVNTPIAGWQTDLSRAAEGRIAATRTSPPPKADLRVAIER